jgi:hypothetical protein
VNQQEVYLNQTGMCRYTMVGDGAVCKTNCKGKNYHKTIFLYFQECSSR